MSKYPFSNGAQAADWLARNCDRCSKDDCEIEAAIMEAWAGDGSVSDEIWKRMGGPGNEDRLTWDCPERKVIK